METYYRGPLLLLNESTVQISPALSVNHLPLFPPILHESSFTFLSLLCYVYPPLCSCCVGSLQCFWLFESLSVVNIVVCSVGSGPVFTRLAEVERGWASEIGGSNGPAWRVWRTDANHLLRQYLVPSLYPDSGRSSESIWIISIATRNLKASGLSLIPVPSWHILLSFKVPLLGYF